MDSKIPVVDLKSAGLGGICSEQDAKEVGKKVLDAFRQIGFVYILNHGLSDQLKWDFLDAASRFFSLPMETKMKHERFGRGKWNGYTPGSEEKLARSERNYPGAAEVEVKEAFDMLVCGIDLPQQDAPDFSRLLVRLMQLLSQLASRLLKLVEEAAARPGLMTSGHRNMLKEGNGSVLRVIHYPEVSADGPPPPAGAVRCGTHTDWGSITLLLQGQTGGLQVRDRSDTWVPAPPIPEAILVNIGDLMEIWTGGELRATKHRVPLPDPNSERAVSRLSIAFFAQPDDDVTVAPPDGGNANYQPVNAGDYLKQKYLATMAHASTICKLNNEK